MKPVLQALVLAERVYEDKSGKKIIAGTFNEVRFKRDVAIAKEVETPSGQKKVLVQGGTHSGCPSAYISLTDVCDNTEIQLQFVNLTKNEPLFGTKLKLACKDRLQTIELIAVLPVLPIAETGVYAFEVVCEGEVLGSCRIRAIEAQ